jgi:glycosyltransferase involved in cell wall biosynthesis
MKIKNLTINMMVKNEERYIEQTLRSVLPFVEHAIIVDTGSTDRTVEIVERLVEEYSDDQTSIEFVQRDVAGDSIVWDGNHLSAELTNIRNDSLERTTTKWVWQVDGDEIYTDAAINDVRLAMASLEYDQGIVGVMVPIKWCVNDTEWALPGPFPKTLRVMPARGEWIGEFPNEFLYVDGTPIHIHDPRCTTTSNPFLHMSMALHPERRPLNCQVVDLTDEEKQLLCLST